jgi:hypothetical protein
MNGDHGELSPEARALVAVGREGDEPTAADRARVRAKLLAGIAGGAVALSAAETAAATQAGAGAVAGTGTAAAGTAAAGAGTAMGASGMLSAKIGAGVLAVALATAGSVAVMRAKPEGPAQQQVERSASKPAAPAAQPSVPVAEPEAPRRGGFAARSRADEARMEEALEAQPRAVVREGEGVTAVPADAIEAPATSTAGEADAPVIAPPARRDRVAAAPRAKRAHQASSARKVAASAVAARSEPAHASTGASNAAAGEEREPTPSLRRELTLIAAAQAALARNAPDEALRWLDAHAAGYAAGEMTEERLAARAVALCALGREAEGKRAGAELARLAPNSPLLARARRACAAREP